MSVQRNVTLQIGHFDRELCGRNTELFSQPLGRKSAADFSYYKLWLLSICMCQSDRLATVPFTVDIEQVS